MKLSGKTAIVTGAGSGMGKAIAELFAKAGANIIAADIAKEALDAVVEAITVGGGKARAVVTNVARQEDIDAMLKAAVDTFGSIDIVVNNAGIMDNFKTVGECSDELWERVMAINLTGPFKICRGAIAVMENQENGGVIINNASVGGLFGSPGGAAYVASKHALLGMTKNLAATYGIHKNIRANAIAPGGVATNIGSTITEPSALGYQALSERGPAPMAQPEQITAIALFLASDDASFTNGATIVADGGWTTR